MPIRIEKTGPVWTIIHSRAEVRNAMNAQHAQALFRAFAAFDADDTARVAVFWGEGGAFCAGYDLKEAATQADPELISALEFPEGEGDPVPGHVPDHVPGPMGPSRMELSKPVIAAIAGPAVAGGMELAMWCDFRVMEEDAFMGVYCRRWGVPLIDGGTVRLPRLVGEGRAAELILTGRRVDAAECAAIGLAEYVVPHGAARQKAEELAAAIARFPQACLRSDRASLRAQAGLSERAALEQEWRFGRDVVTTEASAGAARFASGKGRGGDFDDI
ncbi:MAG: enoyl-CoA hydratase [Rhodobacterales bacterium]|nr:MAG: enoyl-CoA hydratase [Rhodobacterales bacterium]